MIQYCTIQFPASIIMTKNESDTFPSFIFSMVPPTASICIPAACSIHHDLPVILNELSIRDNQKPLTITQCITRQDLKIGNRIETIHMVIIALFATIFTMIIIGTIIEMNQLNRLSSSTSAKNFIIRLLLCFSLARNLGFLFRTKSYQPSTKTTTTTTRTPQIDCLHGIRVLSFLFILIYHTFTEAQIPSANLLKVLGVEHGFLYQFITNAALWVDTFFLLSGFVMAHSFFNQYGRISNSNNSNNDSNNNNNNSSNDPNRQNNKRNPSIIEHLKQHPRRIFHRYIRLTPSVAGVVGLSILIEILGSGPLWRNYVNLSQQSCHKNWWNVLLYINNFCNLNSPTNPQSECLSYLWYLAVDMQFFIISPLLIIFLAYESYRMRTIGIIINIAFILSSSSLTAFLMAWKHLTPTVLVTVYDLDYINMVYKASYCRIGPYCIGILMAYIYHRRHFYHQQEYLINNNDNGDDDDDDQNNQIKNNRSTATGSMLLVISIILMFATTMLTYPWLQGADYINALSILYGAIHRCIWAIAWALFIWAMARQHLPLVDRLFSLPMFQVFSRLTYQSYLLHSVLISAIITSVRQKIYFSELNLVLNVICYYFFTQLISIIMFVMFERPFINIESTFFRNNHHSSSKHRNNISTNSKGMNPTMNR
ncbi:nose resistant to fluoxetine protein 6-like isoform X2 [Dermatophagoides farinae]|uniref:nose resistant to fluoxetine protein 6-like isoform X2 n=1 Tax=Dermatophagoides farinae TaxID=6954 RepID=UPI003F626420